MRFENWSRLSGLCMTELQSHSHAIHPGEFLHSEFPGTPSTTASYPNSLGTDLMWHHQQVVCVCVCYVQGLALVVIATGTS
ncbi:hypothetical protein FOBRF1_003908 [Fusarium oxysporum]